ncbi:MAG: peptidoglycan binding domain-containing protein, partial [Chloroflexota bacterium]|nr:peptidoglycan binding domain-containing protein [Chloroflexota bacterium]
MNEETDKQNRELDHEPAWPQRPPTPRPEPVRPRLDPPSDHERTSDGQPSTGTKWTSTPTLYSHNPATTQPDPSKETLLLPVVETSRFGGRQKAEPPKARVQQGVQTSQKSSRERTPTSAPPPVPASPTSPASYEERYSSHVEQEPTKLYSAIPVPTQANGRGAKAAATITPQYPTEVARRHPFRWMVWTLLGIVAIALIVGTAFTLAWQGQYAGKMYAGVSVLGIPLGGKTTDEARKAISDKLQPFLAQPVVFAWQGKEWQPNSEQIGLKLDIDSTVNEAFLVGRRGDSFGSASQQWLASQQGYNIPLTVQFSEPDLQNYLNTIAGNEINQMLFDGDVRLNGTIIVALAGKEGRALRTYDVIHAVQQSIGKLQPGTKVELPVDITQPT